MVDKEMKITVKDTKSTVDFTGTNDSIKDIVERAFHISLGVRGKGYQFSPQYKRGLWDGVTDFYDKKSHTFPTGLLNDAIDALKNLQVTHADLTYEVDYQFGEEFIEDKEIPQEYTLLDKDVGTITLRDYQLRGVQAALKHRVGIVNGCTGSGKTEVAAGIIKTLKPYLRKDEFVVYFVPSKAIFDEAITRLQERLGEKVGYLGDGKRKLRQINVILMDSMVAALKSPIKELRLSGMNRALQLMVDEVLPKFDGVNANLKFLLQNFVKNYNATTKARDEIEEELTALAFSKKTNAEIRVALNNYKVRYDKLLKKKLAKRYDIYKETLNLVSHTPIVFCDEAHHSKADTYYKTLYAFDAAIYRIGLTGTVDKSDKLAWQSMRSLYREIIEGVSNDEMITRGYSAKPYIKLINITKPRSIQYERNYGKAYDIGIVKNDERNSLIAKLAIAMYNQNRITLIIVNRMEQGEWILNEINKAGVKAEFINGEENTNVRRRQLKDVDEGRLRVLVATTVLDEGVDIHGINCLIMGAGGKSMRVVLQRVGRVLRHKNGDNTAIVFDFIDRTNTYLLKHSKERIKLYESQKFDIKTIN